VQLAAVNLALTDPENSTLIECAAHDVWFRSFRDELSLR
jgi:hypothetical protein